VISTAAQAKAGAAVFVFGSLPLLLSEKAPISGFVDLLRNAAAPLHRAPRSKADPIQTRQADPEPLPAVNA
jgi:hypothetical protein